MCSRLDLVAEHAYVIDDLVVGEGSRVMTSKIQRVTRLFKMNIIGTRQI
jgi:hypothetical protein